MILDTGPSSRASTLTLTLTAFNESTLLLVAPSQSLSRSFYKNQLFFLVETSICRPPVRYNAALSKQLLPDVLF